MRYFGKHNYQPVLGSVKDHLAFHIIHCDGNKEDIAKFLKQCTTTTLLSCLAVCKGAAGPPVLPNGAEKTNIICVSG